ncbi:hypothetical protein L7H23_15450 [Sphingopyxis sp. BSN-002]|uniref:hypothetical protein n=1 Tax=Sphingopyxis sp. BSN-002 TaxID=2911495 RepID=UPI001EDB3C24|nr:hypothetical protein [Sphingopyxis sp. BSN-002]UKK83949.1 hypothetical protein L7H23_15450 [Sphingopyxis sp. BSN-002]
MIDDRTPGHDPARRERHRLIARLLRRALGEQRRTCVVGCVGFPDEQELLGRDLSLMTLVDPDASTTAALRRRFGEAIVIETSPPSPFLARCRSNGERFDLVMLPGLADRTDDEALGTLLGEMVGALNDGGCVLLVAHVSTSRLTGRTLGDFVQLFEKAVGPLDVSAHREGDLAVLAGQLRA